MRPVQTAVMRAPGESGKCKHPRDGRASGYDPPVAWSDDYEADHEADDGYGFDAYGDDYGDDDIETVPCPDCGGEVYEDAVHCPHCGEFIDWRAARSIFDGRPNWWVGLGVLGLVATILTLALIGF